MVLGSAYQPPQTRSMDLARHHLETIRQEKTTRETSQAVERRPGQILERHDMAEDSTRQANMETACWGLRPTTGHYDCPMMNDDDHNISLYLVFINWFVDDTVKRIWLLYQMCYAILLLWWHFIVCGVAGLSMTIIMKIITVTDVDFTGSTEEYPKAGHRSNLASLRFRVNATTERR